jgi:hypothetical protein
MKEKCFSLLLFITVTTLTWAQTNPGLKKQTLHGIVKNEKNKGVQNASVVVKGEEKGTITDSLGLFKIEASPNSILVIAAEGYEPTTKPVNGKELIIVLVKTPDNTNNNILNETITQKQVYNSVQDFGKTEASRFYQGSALTVFHQKEETQGSRYLFNWWVNGTMLDTNLVVINTADFSFNYDKIGKKLLATRDKNTIIEINDAAINSFILKTDTSVTKFERIPAITKKEFLIEVVKNEVKYSLYKSMKTTFQKADYSNNGVIASGKKYDEFVDEFEYYIIFPGGNQFKKVDLKKKSIREALSGEEVKVKQYFSKRESGVVNETFLKELILFLNQ